MPYPAHVADLVRSVGGGSLDDPTILVMFETALDASNALLEQVCEACEACESALSSALLVPVSVLLRARVRLLTRPHFTQASDLMLVQGFVYACKLQGLVGS